VRALLSSTDSSSGAPSSDAEQWTGAEPSAPRPIPTSPRGERRFDQSEPKPKPKVFAKAQKGGNMGFFGRFISWLMSLFGGGSKQLSAADKEKIFNSEVKGLEDVEGAEHIHVHGTGENARILRSSGKADLIEDGGSAQWVNRVSYDVPRANWADDWGPCANAADKLVEFSYHERAFDKIRAGDPDAAEQKIREFGYRDVGHFFYVRGTMLKYAATPQGPNVGDAILQSQEYMTAVLKADAKARDEEQAATAKANPELLAPVEGVSVEMYAQLAARMAQGLPQDQLMAALAQHGVDYPAWERAQQVWIDRMSKDLTGTIGTIYSKAFMSSGQGQYSAAGAATAATGFNGTAAAGGEPMPFDRFCEIDGAMSAWSKTGQDVNALLKSQFNMTAADYSMASTWWWSQITADLSKMPAYDAKKAEYEKKYSGPVQRHDQDIQF
jgi:hypothetical protein